MKFIRRIIGLFRFPPTFPPPPILLWYYSLCCANTADVFWEDWFCCDAITTSSRLVCKLLFGFSRMIDHFDRTSFFSSLLLWRKHNRTQQRIVKWGKMRSQRGVFKKCLADLIAFQYALHSFSAVLSTGAHSLKVGNHWPHWCFKFFLVCLFWFNLENLIYLGFA